MATNLPSLNNTVEAVDGTRCYLRNSWKLAKRQPKFCELLQYVMQGCQTYDPQAKIGPLEVSIWAHLMNFVYFKFRKCFGKFYIIIIFKKSHIIEIYLIYFLYWKQRGKAWTFMLIVLVRPTYPIQGYPISIESIQKLH